MSLIKSISGIRGTIGGRVGEGLTAVDIVRFTAAFAMHRRRHMPQSNFIVVGRDARQSGEMVNTLVTTTLMSMGYYAVDIGRATTPTTEMAVVYEKAAGGIILTASHNPEQWNALKLLNERGEFLSKEEGEEVLKIAETEDIVFADFTKPGIIRHSKDYIYLHIEKILGLKLVDREAIRKKNYRVVIDGVNSVGSTALPLLLEWLCVRYVTRINCEPTGKFAHNPEPLPEHLTEICEEMRQGKADVGFVVDPDVDRLAIVMENGEVFGEEYTLVSIANYVLSHTPGNTVSNLSSTRALRDITLKHGGEYSASAVGEVNVVEEMKRTNAVIGGEGNGGVIYPALHYGRDAMVGIALFLTQMALTGKKPSELRSELPNYCISKNRIDLTADMDVEKVLQKVKDLYKNEQVDDRDGVKIDFKEGWVHLRKSNTEPIIRVYSEASTKEEADRLAQEVIDVVKGL